MVRQAHHDILSVNRIYTQTVITANRLRYHQIP